MPSVDCAKNELRDCSPRDHLAMTLASTVDVHLLRLLDRVTQIIADEVVNCASLERT
jgi:hypothetical protein